MRNDLLSDRRPAGRAPRRTLSLRAILLGLLGLFVLYVLGWWVYGRFIMSDEEKIREAIHGAAQAARDRHPARVTAILSEDFVGPRGMTKDDVHRVMISVLMREYRQVDVALSPIPIPVKLDEGDPDKAAATFRARVRGKIAETSDWEELNPQAGGTLFIAAFKRTEDGWRMSGLSIQVEKE